MYVRASMGTELKKWKLFRSFIQPAAAAAGAFGFWSPAVCCVLCAVCSCVLLSASSATVCTVRHTQYSSTHKKCFLPKFRVCAYCMHIYDTYVQSCIWKYRSVMLVQFQRSIRYVRKYMLLSHTFILNRRRKLTVKRSGWDDM